MVGTCNDFCPLKELQLRKKEILLNKFETGKGLVPIKEYSRPSAGQASPDALSIRTPETLLECVAYIVQLIDHFIHREDPLQLYEFLQDWLRAVRQDMLVQLAVPEIRKRILYTCVSFHVVFGHILSNNPALSAKINSQHQLGCTKSCLLLPKYACPCRVSSKSVSTKFRQKNHSVSYKSWKLVSIFCNQITETRF